MPPGRDELASGRPDDARPRRGLRGVTAALVVLALTGVGLDRWERDRQLDQLLTAASRTEAVIGDARRSLAGLVQYSAALLARPDTEPAQRQAVLDALWSDTDRYAVRLDAPRAELARLDPLPWDDDLARARTAWLARLDGWRAFVASSRSDPERLLRERPLTAAQRARAGAALEDAAAGRRTETVGRLREALGVR